MAKVYSADEIRNKLQTSDKWLIRGLLAIYAKQTADERASENTKYENGVGFNGTDANILSSFAKQVLAWEATPANERRYPTPLSLPRGDKPGQMGLLRRKMLKYAGQLARIADQNNPVEDATPPVHKDFDALMAPVKTYRGGAQAELDVDEDEAAVEAAAERAAIMAEEFDGEPFDEFAGQPTAELAW
jgi:hypothetical protein